MGNLAESDREKERKAFAQNQRGALGTRGEAAFEGRGLGAQGNSLRGLSPFKIMVSGDLSSKFRPTN